MKDKSFLLGLFLCVITCQTFAQSLVDQVIYTVDKKIPTHINLSFNQVDKKRKQIRDKTININRERFLHQLLKLNDETTVIETDSMSDIVGGKHYFFVQYYKGIEVNGTRYSIHIDNKGSVTSVNGNFRTIDNLNVVPQISQSNALRVAINYLNAKEYAWQNDKVEQYLKQITNNETATFYPKGKLSIYFKEEIPHLAYVFNIRAIEPALSECIYIDAHNGDVIDCINTLTHIAGTAATGIANTRYSGTRSIATTVYKDKYYLQDLTRGNGIVTTNVEGDVYWDNDNNWTAEEWHYSSIDDGAFDAHWGICQAYDYFSTKFRWISYDNKGSIIQSIVNQKGNRYKDNAEWYGEQKLMIYGITSAGKPVTCLDILAHEYAHAITSSTSNLVNYGENGALNEGLSDIWGVCVERYVKPEKGDNIWILGEDLKENQMIRDLRNPVCKFYKGEGWVNTSSILDNGGVHTNNGVIGYWFYLLVNGGSYQGKRFLGVGFDKAEQICFLLQTAYLNSSSSFKDARKESIMVAETLFGENSEEAISVNNAWVAVGVEDNFLMPQIEGLKLLDKGEIATFTIKNMPINAKLDLGGVKKISFNGSELTVEATAGARAYINIISSIQSFLYASHSLWVGPPQIFGVNYNAKEHYLEPNTFGGDAEITNVIWNVYGGGYEIYPFRYHPYLTSGTIDVSVQAKNRCGIGPVYSCKVTLGGNEMLSIVQSSDTRTITVLSEQSSVDNSYVNYQLTNVVSGLSKSGRVVLGGTIFLEQEKQGLYVLNLSMKGFKPSSFKISLK